jgi:hypothetical protein
MRRALLHTFLGVLAAVLLPAQAPEEWAFRTVEGQVLAPDGKPVEGEKVLLIGLDRNAFTKLDDAEKNEGWNFTTDQDGKFTVKLGRFSALEHSEKTKKWLPGWGEYFLVIRPGTKHAGAVSPRLLHFSGDLPELPAEEVWGKPVVLTEGINEMALQLRQGITVTGKIQDTNGNSVPDLEVALSHELSPLSSTGIGTEIFQRDSRTDRHGYVEFKNIHPTGFHLGLTEGPPYWVQTRVGAQWQDGIIDQIEVLPKAREILVGIVVSSQKMYRYYGKVTDAKGKPIEGAKVVLGISQHRRATTHRDQNDFVEANSGPDGSYDVRTETPWVRGFSVTAPGYAEVSNWQQEKMLKPGIYNFLMKKPK